MALTLQGKTDMSIYQFKKFSPPNGNRAFWMAIFTGVILMIASCDLYQSTEPIPTSTFVPAATSTPSPTQIVPQVNRLLDSFWILSNYGNEADPRAVQPQTVYSAAFQNDGTLSGSAECNSYTASFVAQDEDLEISSFISSDVQCKDNDGLEKTFIAALQKADAYKVTENGILEIFYSTTSAFSEKLVFVPGQIPLLETHWTLVSYGDKDKPTLISDGVKTSLIFTELGQLVGFGGCNGYAAAYKLEEDGVFTIDPIVVGSEPCSFGKEQETALLNMIASTNSYNVSGSTLYIDSQDGANRLTFTSLYKPIEHTLWNLESINGNPANPAAPLVIQLVPGEGSNFGKMGGLLGCSHFNAKYHLDNFDIFIENLITEGRICSSEIYDMEAIYKDSLRSAQSFRLLGTHLSIYSAYGSLVFSAANPSLEGAEWNLISHGDAKNPIKPLENSFVKTIFRRAPGETGGLATGRTGCSNFNAVYNTIPGLLEFTSPHITHNLDCDPLIIKDDQQFISHLEKVESFKIYSNFLLIPSGTSILNFVAKLAPISPDVNISSLVDQIWFLVSMEDAPVDKDTTITAVFSANPEETSGGISGTSGCNDYSANIGPGFILDSIIATAKACDQPDGVMAQETSYLNLLQNSIEFFSAEDELVILTAGGRLIFNITHPSQPTDPRLRLVNQTWYLTNINGQPTLNNVEVSTIFNYDGSMNGHTGCNLFSARFFTEDDTITITPIAKTSDPCQVHIQAQETAFLNVVQNATKFIVDTTKLKINSPSGSVTFLSTLPAAP